MSNNYMIFLKRAVAYLVDIFIVFFIGTIIAIIPVFDKYKSEYKILDQEFLEFNKNNSEFIKLFKDNYIDGNINQEEYDKLILFADYNKLIIERYDDSEINKMEYHTILKESDRVYNERELEFNYKIRKTLTYNSVITLLSMLCYFGFFQFILKGQTIGKKIMHLRVVSINGENLSLGWGIIRSLIVNNIFLNTINLGCLWLLNMNMYNSVVNVTDTLISIVEAIIIYLIIVRDDARGLHDLIARTKVIVEEEKKYNKNDKVIEGKYVEK